MANAGQMNTDPEFHPPPHNELDDLLPWPSDDERSDKSDEGSDMSELDGDEETERKMMDEDEDDTEGAGDSEIEGDILSFISVHARLDRLITHQLKILQKPKRMLNDTQAANSVFTLKALRMFNNERLRLAKSRCSLEERVLSEKLAPLEKHRTKVQIDKIRPLMDASLTIARRLNKGLYFACMLRNTAYHLVQTGELPRKQQGKDAIHVSLLNHLDVKTGVRRWLNGYVSANEGGLVGNVGATLSRRCRRTVEY